MSASNIGRILGVLLWDCVLVLAGLGVAWEHSIFWSILWGLYLVAYLTIYKYEGKK